MLFFILRFSIRDTPAITIPNFWWHECDIVYKATLYRYANVLELAKIMVPIYFSDIIQSNTSNALKDQSQPR